MYVSCSCPKTRRSGKLSYSVVGVASPPCSVVCGSGSRAVVDRDRDISDDVDGGVDSDVGDRDVDPEDDRDGVPVDADPDGDVDPDRDDGVKDVDRVGAVSRDVFPAVSVSVSAVAGSSGVGSGVSSVEEASASSGVDDGSIVV